MARTRRRISVCLCSSPGSFCTTCFSSIYPLNPRNCKSFGCWLAGLVVNSVDGYVNFLLVLFFWRDVFLFRRKSTKSEENFLPFLVFFSSKLHRSLIIHSLLQFFPAIVVKREGENDDYYFAMIIGKRGLAQQWFHWGATNNNEAVAGQDLQVHRIAGESGLHCAGSALESPPGGA